MFGKRSIFKDQSGSSLLQTAITLIVVSVLVGASVAIIQPLVLEKPKEETHKQLDPIKVALSEFAARHGRLPCPARLDVATDTADFGREYCDATPAAGSGVELSTVNSRDGRVIRSGGLPVRTLDMSDDYFRDGYQNPYLYSVTELVTSASGDLNHDGGIYVKDANGIDVNVNPGWVLYTLVSTGGRGNIFDCDLSKADSENCNRDGVFLVGEYSQAHTSADFYDDHIAFSEREPSDPYSLCGSKGKVYAPAQLHKDRDDCVSVMSYKEFDTARIASTQEVTCTSLNDFCEDEWISVMAVASGDYIFHWDSYLRFDYAQPGQYAVVEFKIGANTVESRHIPFNGSECEAEGNLQHVKGVSRIATEYAGELQARIKYYGGSYDSARCAGEVSKLTMVSAGQGLQDNRKAMTVKAFSRFGEGRSVGQATGVVAAGTGPIDPFEDPAAVAVITDVSGKPTIRRENGIVEDIVMDMIVKSQDFINTQTDGVVTMLFVDGTEITLSEGSKLDISQYEFDENTGAGEAEYSLVSGVLLYIGGLLDASGNVTIDTAAGSVGIRGTSFILRVDVIDYTPGLTKRVTTGPNGMMELVTIECCVNVAIKQYANETQKQSVLNRLTSLSGGETRSEEEWDAINYFASKIDDYAVMQPRKPWQKVVALVNRRPEGMGNEKPSRHQADLSTMRDDIVEWYNGGELRKEIHPIMPEYKPTDNVEAAVNILSVVRGLSDETRQTFHDQIVKAVSEANGGSGAPGGIEEPIPMEPVEVIDTDDGSDPGAEYTGVADADPCYVDPYSDECTVSRTPLSCGAATEGTAVLMPSEADMCRGGDVQIGSVGLNRGAMTYQWVCEKTTMAPSESATEDSGAGGASSVTETVACETEIAENWLGILYAKVFSRQPDADAMWHKRAFDSGDSIDHIYEVFNESCEAQGTCPESSANCQRVLNPGTTSVCDEPLCINSYHGRGLEYMIEQTARNAGCSQTEISDLDALFIPDPSGCRASDGFMDIDVEPYECPGPGGSKITVGNCSKYDESGCIPFIGCTHDHRKCTDGEYYECKGKKGNLTGAIYSYDCKKK